MIHFVRTVLISPGKMAEAMAFAKEIASYSEGLTGFIVANEQEAAGAVPRLATLSRQRIRARFEERFTARRMAEDYLKIYRDLAEARVPRLRVVKA